MGWHKVDFLGLGWMDKLSEFVAGAEKHCVKRAPEKAAILSKEAPGFQGARVFLSPEVSAALENVPGAYRLVPCNEPRPEDFDTVEFQIGTDWSAPPKFSR